MMAKVWPWLRVLAGVGILAGLAYRLGTDAFLAGLRMISVSTLLIALGIGVMTTVLSAWRWCIVARCLGLRLPLSTAVGDYYRALFLNAVLPAGILGDVDRAVRHGRHAGDVGRGVRAVVLERVAGQLVLFAVGAVVLVSQPELLAKAARALVPSPTAAIALAAALTAVVATVLWVRRRRRGGTEPGAPAGRWDGPRPASHVAPHDRPNIASIDGPPAGAAGPGRPRGALDPGTSATAAPSRTCPGRSGPSRTSRWRAAVDRSLTDVRLGLFTRAAWPGVLLSSAATLAGHLLMFLVAARVVGFSTPFLELLPMMVLALVAMGLPVNVGGWGPREAVSALAFGAAGLGAEQGLATAVVYGVLAFVASLPGAWVLIARRRPKPFPPIPEPRPAVLGLEDRKVFVE